MEGYGGLAIGANEGPMITNVLPVLVGVHERNSANLGAVISQGREWKMNEVVNIS
jgi:hypothetical protein